MDGRENSMTQAIDTTQEMKVAEKVLEPLEHEHWSEDDKFIRIRIRKGPGSRLASVIFSKLALRRLISDPDRDVKVEYLRRDIARQARWRREYRYPRQLVVETT
jgi:hypothetical protein